MAKKRKQNVVNNVTHLHYHSNQSQQNNQNQQNDQSSYKDSMMYRALDKSGGGVESTVFSALLGVLTFLPKVMVSLFSKFFYRIFNVNSKISGSYITNGKTILKFPLICTESIDQSIVNKFCAMLQIEKAENIRTFFFNHNLHLGYAPEDLAHEFSSGFYKEDEELSEVSVYNGKDLKRGDFEITNSLYNSKKEKHEILKISSQELMPINPTIIHIAANKQFSSERVFSALGIRYIPHRVPFHEMPIAFKYGALNSRVILRFIKWMKSDITFGDFLFGKDKEALNEMFTKVVLDKKSWNKAMKDSTHAVTLIMSKREFDKLCEEVVDLTKPSNFKHFQKDIGYLDLIVLDPDKAEFIRMNASDNYEMVHYNIREALTAQNKDIVIKTKIEASKFHDEGVI